MPEPCSFVMYWTEEYKVSLWIKQCTGPILSHSDSCSYYKLEYFTFAVVQEEVRSSTQSQSSNTHNKDSSWHVSVLLWTCCMNLSHDVKPQWTTSSHQHRTGTIMEPTEFTVKKETSWVQQSNLWHEKYSHIYIDWRFKWGSRSHLKDLNVVIILFSL